MRSEKSYFRYRIEFSKTSALRFTSHLDTLRAWERTFRRAELPLVYTQGFNPRPRINLSAALPLGYTSECELIDIWLMEENQSNVLLERIRAVLPPGLDVREVAQIDEQAPKLQQIIQAAEYYVLLDPFPSEENLKKQITQLLESTKILRERRGKTYDLRPRIEALEVRSCNGIPSLRMRLATKEGFVGRPEEVLLALGLDPTLARIHRSSLFLQNPYN